MRSMCSSTAGDSRLSPEMRSTATTSQHDERVEVRIVVHAREEPRGRAQRRAPQSIASTHSRRR
jgi:hypothetical protein